MKEERFTCDMCGIKYEYGTSYTFRMVREVSRRPRAFFVKAGGDIWIDLCPKCKKLLMKYIKHWKEVPNAP